jgi:hypothetical protein
VAGSDRTPLEEVVRDLVREHSDVVRAAVEPVCRGLTGSEATDRRRAQQRARPIARRTRIGFRSCEWQARTVEELQILKLASVVVGARPSLGAGAAHRDPAGLLCGVSTRRVAQLVEAPGLLVSTSEVSRICPAVGRARPGVRTQPLGGRYSYISSTPRSRTNLSAAASSIQGRRARTARTGPASARVLGIDVGEHETEVY